MSGFKKYSPEIRFASALVTPDEIDAYTQYIVLNPSVGSAYIGTADSGGTVSEDLTISASRLDYPRNLLVTHENGTSAADGTTGGTLTVKGKNQFGESLTEAIAITPATGDGTGTGTSVFAEVGTASWVANGSATVGTLGLGVAIGTSATSPMFGLPVKLGGTSDIKAITWIDNGVAKQHDAAAAANTNHHAFKGTAAVAAADSYVVLVKSTFNAENIDKIANL